MNSTVKGKIIFYSLISFFIFAFLFIDSERFINYGLVNNENEDIEISKINSERQFIKYSIINFGTFIITLVLMLKITQIGRLTKKFNQFPPPGINIPYKIKLRYGKDAVSWAKGLYVVAASILLQVGAITYMAISFLYENNGIVQNL